MNVFEQAVRRHGEEGVQATGIRVMQVNLGFRCNLQCRHCHVEASPDRLEEMTWSTMEAVLEAGRQVPGCLMDLTGGTPELNPNFRQFVTASREQGH